jgi:hypothetical protein
MNPAGKAVLKIRRWRFKTVYEGCSDIFKSREVLPGENLSGFILCY